MKITMQSAGLLQLPEVVGYDDLIAEQDRWLEAQLLEDEYEEWITNPLDWEEAL